MATVPSATSTGSLVARPPIHVASFETWNPTRYDEIFLFYESEVNRENYRYKLTVIDQLHSVTTNRGGQEASRTNNHKPFVYATVVFLIPAGRESEFMFQSISGLRAIASSAGSARLIAVTFGRHHVFPSQTDVQTELAYVIQRLKASQALPESPHSAIRSNGSTAAATNTSTIPFMALDGIGHRNVLASGISAVSGRYLVEQCVVTGSDQGQPQSVRRLYFLDGNPFVIQSEVALTPVVLPNSQISDNGVVHNDNTMFTVDKSITAFEYHKCLTAGIMALLPNRNASCLLLGLGGGGLVNLWHYLKLTWRITAVELDSSMPEIAQTYFALDTEQITIQIGDGLHVHCVDIPDSASSQHDVDDAASSDTHSETATSTTSGLAFQAASLDCIVIDVDSKDSGSGMSCPPAAFVDVVYLERLRTLLCPGSGVLAINVSARDATAFHTTCTAVQSVFPTVFLSKRARRSEDMTLVDTMVEPNVGDDDDDDLNVVVFATQMLSIPSNKEMSDHLTQQMQVSWGPQELDEVMISDFCLCTEDFVPWNGTDTNPRTTSSKKKSSNNKRRNNKRGCNKKR